MSIVLEEIKDCKTKVYSTEGIGFLSMTNMTAWTTFKDVYGFDTKSLVVVLNGKKIAAYRDKEKLEKDLSKEEFSSVIIFSSEKVENINVKGQEIPVVTYTGPVSLENDI